MGTFFFLLGSFFAHPMFMMASHLGNIFYFDMSLDSAIAVALSFSIGIAIISLILYIKDKPIGIEIH